MNELTLRQVDIISKYVYRNEIVFSHLYDDLVDHICCDLEESIRSGDDFDKAFRAFRLRIGGNGLTNIQKDTLFAVDSKYRKMKKTMKISGVAGTVLLGLSPVFKFLHLPGAGILLSLGALILVSLFLPSSLMVLWKESNSGKRLFLFTTAFLASALFIIGVLFKVQHWPGSGIILSAGLLTGILLFMPALISKIEFNTDSKVPTWIYRAGILAIALFGAGFLFKIMHWPGASILLVVSSCLISILIVPLYFYHRWKEDNSISLDAIFIIFVAVMFIVPIAIVSLDTSRNFEKLFLVSSDLNNRNIEFRIARNKDLLTLQDFGKDQEIGQLNTIVIDLLSQIEDIENSIIPSFGDNKQLMFSGEKELQSHLYNYDNTKKVYAPGVTLLPDLEKKLQAYKDMVNTLNMTYPETLLLTTPDLNHYLPEYNKGKDYERWIAPIAVIQSLETLKGAILDAEAATIRNLKIESNNTK
ncbi:MAG: hypothetical protein K8R35_09620 [Bacteroidales bacterium]|nr:hypothetical protein [Bacteroidales bacterium]